MNFFVAFSAFISLLTIISIIIEPRRFRNGLYFLFSMGCWFLTLLQYYLMYKNKTIEIFLIMLIIAIPLLYGFIMFYLFINGLKIIKKEGFSISHSLSFLFSLLMLFLPFIFLILLCINFRTGHFGISLAAVTLLTYFLITFTIFFCYSLIYCLMPRRLNCQYIIIHGAGLLPDGSVTPLLQARIDKALKLYHKSKNSPKLVPSGGKGIDEKISEAEAIKNYLTSKGIPEKDIIIEDGSTTTYENLLFVKKLLDNIEGSKKYSCLFVTNNYHVFRTALYAKKIKLNAQGVGCHTAGYFLPSAFLREYFAVMKMQKFSLIILFAIIIAELYFF